MSTQVTYETNHIFLLCDSTISSVLNFVFNVLYCNVKDKNHIRRNINSKKGNLYLISIDILQIVITCNLYIL